MSRFDMVRLSAWQTAMDDLDAAQATVWNLGYDRGMHGVETTERLWLGCDALRDAVEVLIDLVAVDEKAKTRMAAKWKLDDSEVDGYGDLLSPVRVLADEAGRVARRNGYVHAGNIGEGSRNTEYSCGQVVAAAVVVAIDTYPELAEAWIDAKTMADMEDAQQNGWAGANVVLAQVASCTEAEFEEFYEELTGRYRSAAIVKLGRLVAKQVIRTAKEQVKS